MAALEAYLANRAERAGAAEWRQLGGPLLATAPAWAARKKRLPADHGHLVIHGGKPAAACT